MRALFSLCNRSDLHCTCPVPRCGFLSDWTHKPAKMDFQHRAGGKTGSGGVASASESNRDRRERLRQLALETIDINKDPYFMKNHLGSYECKLCLTLHNNEVRRQTVKLSKTIPEKFSWISEKFHVNSPLYCRAAIWLIHKERSIRPICKSVSVNDSGYTVLSLRFFNFSPN